MWSLFKKAEPVQAISEESELPPDINAYLANYQVNVSDEEFAKVLKSTLNNSKLASPPSIAELTGKPSKEALSDNLASLQKLPMQASEPLSMTQLRQQEELESYRRKNPALDAVVENCSEIQQQFYDCLENGSIDEKAKNCISKQNFHQECISKQLLIFKMFDYESVDKIRALDEIRGTADVVFNRHFKCYDDIGDEAKNSAFYKELQMRKTRFLHKYH